MFEVFLLFFALVPMMLGLAEIIHILKLYILKPENPIISYRAVILTNNTPLEHMRYVMEQYSWHLGKNAARPVFINSLLNEENFKECKALANTSGFGYYSFEEASEYLKLIIM